MTAPQNVELEAAKFLQKLIQDSTDEPTKLATKLHVILQHMRSSGKENSMPYQVISRAMETVINQHNLDIEALMQSRIPMAGGTQAGDSATSQFAGSSQRTGVAKDSKFEHEMARNDAFISNRSPVGPSGAVHDIYQGSVSHMNSNKPFDHESPSSFDTRSANSQSQVSEKDSKRSSNKRKRADPSLVIESHNMQPPDSRHLSRSSNLKNPEDIEVSSAHNSLGLQQGGRSIPLTQDGVNSRSLRNQNNAGGFPFEKSQASRFSFPNAAGNSSQEIGMHHSSPSSLGSGAVSKIHGGVPGNMGSYAASEQMNPNPHFSSSYDNNALVANMSKDRSVETYSAVKHEGGIQSSLANANKVDQGGFPNTVAEMTMLRNAASRDTGKSPISQGTTVPSMPFKEQHLKQLRAQCLVYLAFRNGLMPKKLHLDIALGNIFPIEDGTGKELIDHKEKEHSINDPSSNPEVKMPFGRTENSNMAVERIGSASGPSEHAEETESLEKISVSASISEETAVPIVDSDFKETEDQSAKMDVDEPESTVHALVSDSSEVSLGQKRSPSQPLVTAEPFVESGIVEETEDQSENMDTVEAVISDPGDACLDDKTSLNPPVDTPETEILEKNSVATSILEETAVPIAKPDLKETEDQSAKMAVEPESTVQALISDSSEVSLEEKISPSQPLVTAEPFVESCIVEELGVEVAASKESDSNEKMTDLGKPVEEDSDAKIDEVEGSFAAADGTDLEAKVKLVDYSPDDSLDRDVSTPLNDG